MKFPVQFKLKLVHIIDPVPNVFSYVINMLVPVSSIDAYLRYCSYLYFLHKKGWVDRLVYYARCQECFGFNLIEVLSQLFAQIEFRKVLIEANSKCNMIFNSNVEASIVSE